MDSEIYQCFLELDQLVDHLRSSSVNPEPTQKYQNMIYSQFLYELQKKAKKNSHISAWALKKIKNLFKSVYLPENKQNEKAIVIRGRPVKNLLAQIKLGEWIKSQNRTQFTKKELQKQYASYLPQKQRPFSTNRLLRLLDRCQIQNIQIVTKQVGNRLKRRRGKAQFQREQLLDSIYEEEEEKQSPPKIENDDKPMYLLLSEDDEFFRMPEEGHDQLFESLLNNKTMDE